MNIEENGMSNSQSLIRIDPAPKAKCRSLSLWKVDGRMYLQRPNEAKTVEEIEEMSLTYRPVMEDPHLAIAAFLLKASKKCGSFQSVVRVEIDSVEWVSWVDGAMPMG